MIPVYFSKVKTNQWVPSVDVNENIYPIPQEVFINSQDEFSQDIPSSLINDITSDYVTLKQEDSADLFTFEETIIT